MVKSKHYVGEIVVHHGHECRVLETWVDPDNGKPGITICPTGNYGFPRDIYDDQLTGGERNEEHR